MKKKRVLALCMAAMMTFSLIGCSGGNNSSDQGDSDGGDGVIKIELPTYRAGEDPGAEFFLGQVDRFNQEYEGVYEIEVTYSGGSDDHNEKIKQLGLQGELPVVFQFSDFVYAETNFFKDGVLYDMSEWLDENPDLKNMFLPESMEYVTQDDGSIYALPSAIVRPNGIYYNTQGFVPSKTIRDMTWDEFMNEMNEQGALYGFQTAEQGWTLNQTTVAIMGSLDGGAELLQAGIKDKITDFTGDLWQETFTTLKELYDAAGWTDGLGKAYPDTENAFLNNIISVLPNGQWVISNLTSTDEQYTVNWGDNYDGTKVCGDIFPGNVAVQNTCTYDWYISGTASEDELELAKTFIKFINTQDELEAMAIAEGGSVPMTTPSEEYLSAIAENKVMNEFATTPNDETIYVPNFNDVVTTTVLDAFGANLPTLLQGNMSVEDFCQALTTAASE